MTWQVESQAYGVSPSQGAPDSTYNSHAHAVSNHTSDAWGVGVGLPKKDGPVEDLFINPQWAFGDSFSEEVCVVSVCLSLMRFLSSTLTTYYCDNLSYPSQDSRKFGFLGSFCRVRR